MIINFKSKYISLQKMQCNCSLHTFYFYDNYKLLYVKKLVRYNDGININFLRINQSYFKTMPIVDHICILSNQIINNKQLVFHIELEDENCIFYIQPAQYINNKLIVNESDIIYNYQQLHDIDLDNYIIKKKILRQIKQQCINIINSRNILNLL